MDRHTDVGQSVIFIFGFVEITVMPFKKDIYIGYALVTNQAQRTLISPMVNSHPEAGVNLGISSKQVAFGIYIYWCSKFIMRVLRLVI